MEERTRSRGRWWRSTCSSVRTFRLPLVPVFVAYAAGLCLGQGDAPIPSVGWVLLLSLLLLTWILFLVGKRPSGGTWVALGFFLCLGILSIHLTLHPPRSPSHVSRFNGAGRLVLGGTIDRPLDRSPEGVRVVLRSQEVIFPNRVVPVTGKVLLFFETEAGLLRLGDRLRVTCRLQTPQGFHNPGGFEYERYLAFQKIYTVGFVSEKDPWVRMGEGFGNPILIRIETWRDHIRRFIDREASPPSSAVLKALVLGERGDVAEEVTEQFVATGIAHLLAISGDHLGIVALLSFSLILWVLKRSETLLLTLSVKKWAAGLTIPCILLYTFVAGGGISVVRATIMVVVFFLSILFGRERNLLHTLALAAFVILVVSPPSLWDVSFQLSFMAVLSILYLVPRLLPVLKGDEILPPPSSTWNEKLWKYVKLSFLVTAVASFGTAPWVALHFNRFSPLGLLTNLIMIPWVGFILVPLALVSSLVSFFVYPVAALLLDLTAWVTAFLLRVVGGLASLPLASFYVSTPTAFEMILFYGIFFLLGFMPQGKKILLLMLGLTLFLGGSVAYWKGKALLQKDLVVTFADVGQGDAILIEFPKGERMLIDGGGVPGGRFDVGRSVVAPLLWKKKIKRIDTLVLTHPDPDHLNGLVFVASHFRIGEFWSTGFLGDSEASRQLEEVLARKRIPRRVVHERTPPREINGVTLSVLSPEAGTGVARRGRERSWVNNRSLVMSIRFGSVSLLFTGDIEHETEEGLLRKGRPLKADILKVPHHGSASSSTPRFVESVSPAYAVLTVAGRSRSHLPHPEVLGRYVRAGVQILRTDRHGAITVSTDGKTIRIRTFRDAAP